MRSIFTLSEKTSANLGWAVALLSVVFTIVALSPTFRSLSMSEKSLELAQWTALKDYIEECREELAAGMQSKACLRAMDAQLPPPPYVKPGLLDRRGGIQMHGPGQITTRFELMLPPPKVNTGFRLSVWLSVVAAAVCICGYAYNKWTHFRRIQRTLNTREISFKAKKRVTTPVLPTKETASVTTTIRHPPSPPESILRRRSIRNHPIYRHANLEEAFHHQDLPEIRLRLTNGEDVNDHWPYLIYKLAISPPSCITPTHIEIARLCLDFGADVNTLKGWEGQSALLIAIHFGNVAIARLLIRNGANVSYAQPDYKTTALHRCMRLAAQGNGNAALEIMELLFEAGADANQVDRVGETALHKLLIDAWMASEGGNRTKESLLPVAVALVKRGAWVPRDLKARYRVDNPILGIVQAVAEMGPQRMMGVS